MRSFPYIRLVRFLISTKADVGNALRALKLPFPDWRDLVDLRKQLLATPQPPIVEAWFRGTVTPVEGSEAFLVWCAVHGVRELWERRLGAGPDHFEDACRAFSNPAIRTVLATLLMVGFDHIEVQELLYSKYHLRISTESVAFFQRVFWDVDVMSRQDWALLLEEMEKDQRSQLVYAFSDLGKDGVKLSLGMVPEVDIGAILGDVASTSYFRYKQALDQPVPDDARAQTWAKLAIAAAEKKKRHGGGPSRSLSEEVQMQLTHDREKIPTLADLQAEEKK